jgi:predicted TIM-barrel fold metal-dependent hydrolase
LTQPPLIDAGQQSGRRTPEEPAAGLPRGACDCHVHLFGPPERYPLLPGRAYTPGLAEAADAAAHLDALGLERLVLVQPSPYGFVNRCLLDGLAVLGDRARGIAVTGPDLSDAELADLDSRGVRGIRVNLGDSRGDVSGQIAEAVAAYGARLAGSRWVLQLHAPAAALVAAGAALSRSPVPLVIDHFGHVPVRPMLDQAACRGIERILEEADAHLKLSAPYRITEDPDGLARMGNWVGHLADRWPERLIWGSDWPHTPPHGDHSFRFRDIDTARDLVRLLSWLPDAQLRKRILADNPARLFGFPPAAPL